MSDAPHHRAAFINALAEEGTKAEVVEYLQKTWNNLCEARARIRELEEERDMLIKVLRALAGEGE